MKISELRKLGVELRESLTSTTANAEAMSADLLKKLQGGKEVVMKAKKIRQNVYQYSFDTLKEQKLNEEAIEVKLASDVWAEGKGAAKKYISSMLYLAKLKDDDADKMEVFTEVENTLKLYATMPLEEFNVAFAPLSKTQKPDVEGYSKYRDAANVEAFKYEGDTVKLDNEDGGTKMKLTSGDYLLQSDDGENFKYFVVKAEDFEGEYSEK